MKKITAMLTAIALLAGLACQPVFAAFSDVPDSNRYRKAITTLNKLSVIDGYEENGSQLFKPENTVTRAEFTKLIVFILGLQNQNYSSYTFADANTHWAKDYIQTGYNLGIIAGFEDATFRPEEPVTYEQALKMVDCALGYDSMAQSMGGWPEGYKQQASQLGLDKNVSGAAFTQGAQRGVIAQVLYNALEVDICEYNGHAWTRTNKTLLNDYLQVKELKGTVVGVEDSVTEECTHSLLEDEMDIMTSSGEEYVLSFASMAESAADMKKYLGNKITVYYRQKSDKDDRELVIIDDETNKNKAYEIRYDDIESFSGNILKYYDGTAKAKQLKLKDEDLTVRYNGKTVSAGDNVRVKSKTDGSEQKVTRAEALKLWLDPDTDTSIYGTVKLTDSSNNGVIDMIQIYDYETIVAYASPSTSDYRVTDKLVTGNFLPLDPQAANYTYTIMKNDASIEATSIAANDVILYAKSLDDSDFVLSLLVSNKTVKGSISSINADGTEMTISNQTYQISPKCIEYVREKQSKELKTGVSGTFYLDALGTVVFATVDQTAVAPYAYITSAYLESREDDKAYVSVYSTNISGNAKSYPVKDRVKFNGTTIEGSQVVDKLASSAAYANHDADMAEKIYGAGKKVEGTAYAQPARVTIKNNEITEIVTLESDELQAENEDKEKLVRGKELDQYKYSSNGFTLDNKTAFTVNSSTIVLCPPADRGQKTKYAKKTPSSAFTTGDMYYVEAYDISSSKVAGLVILYGSDGSLTKPKKDTDFSVAVKTPEMSYDDVNDKSVLSLEVFTGTASSPKEWTTYDDSEFKSVHAGDVIQFAYDSDQYVQGRVNCISYEDINTVLGGSSFDWSDNSFDYRFKNPSTGEDEMYTSSSIGTVPYSRACMYNVSQVLPEEKKLYVTRSGFDASGTLDDSDYEEITIQSSTKILRYDEAEEEITPYAPDTTTNMTINDLKDAKNYGINCSKILVCTLRNAARLIVVYK